MPWSVKCEQFTAGCIACPECYQPPSPLPSPPPSPRRPPPPFTPIVEAVQFSVTLGLDASSFEYIGFQSKLSAALAISADYISLALTPGSLTVTSTITPPPGISASEVSNSIARALPSTAAASSLLGVSVLEMTPVQLVAVALRPVRPPLLPPAAPALPVVPLQLPAESGAAVVPPLPLVPPSPPALLAGPTSLAPSTGLESNALAQSATGSREPIDRAWLVVALSLSVLMLLALLGSAWWIARLRAARRHVADAAREGAATEAAAPAAASAPVAKSNTWTDLDVDAATQPQYELLYKTAVGGSGSGSSSPASPNARSTAFKWMQSVESQTWEPPSPSSPNMPSPRSREASPSPHSPTGGRPGSQQEQRSPTENDRLRHVKTNLFRVDSTGDFRV